MFDHTRAHHKITSAHLERLAYVYIRQSTLLQVRENTTSTERQYQLRERAYDLGWPQERILIIDEDQGHSGASSADRTGFQRLVLEVSLGRVGAVIGLEVSRLARSNSDWYRLLELCASTNCLVIDDEGVYDPHDFNDRLILGMKGNLSEYELHFLKCRLHGGKMRKAEQARLRLRLPVGYVYDEAGRAVFDPDERVQEAIRLAFELFAQLGSGLAVVKFFREHQLLFPVQREGSLHDGKVIWQPLRHGRLIQLLHIPVYAGVYVFGRTSRQRKPGQASAALPLYGTRRVALEDWPIVVHDVYPAYLSWEQFLRNRQQLDDNRTYRDQARRGAVREGAALLQGIAICGRCGRRLSVGYSGHRGSYLQYLCARRHNYYAEGRCQTIPGRQVDQAISEAFLQAITPAQLAVSLSTLKRLQDQAAQVERQWQLRLERARYEAERAYRQYDKAEPENRLVTRTLEKVWEEKLGELERLQREYERRPRPQMLILTAEAYQKVLDLAQDLPALWHAETTTHQERKQLIRLLVKDVTLKKESATIKLALRWQTEAVTELEIERPCRASETRRNDPQLVERVRQMANIYSDRQIVTILNAEGVKSATGHSLTRSMVKWMRWAHGIATACAAKPTGRDGERRGDGRYSTRAAAKILNVTVSTINQWCQAKKLDAQQEVRHGPWWIKLSQRVIKELGKASPRRHQRVAG